MKSIDRSFISQNILKLINYAGVSDVDFANLLDISKRTILRIRNNEAYFGVKDINIAADFFQIPVSKINSQMVKFEENYRHKLIEKHKNNTEYLSILNKRPSITYAIEFYLLKNQDFQDKGFVVKEIENFFKQLNWDFSSSYISNAMTRNSNFVKVNYTKVINSKEVNVYIGNNDK